jgi:hypothetical protein
MDTLLFFLDRAGLTVDSMKTVSKSNGQMLNVPTAANDDRLDEVRPHDRSIEASGAWDAYDVWRRFIKEARERRSKVDPNAH